MDSKLQAIADNIRNATGLSDAEKELLLQSIKEADKGQSLTKFKLERLEHDKQTLSVVLAESIEDLQKKSRAIEEQNRELEIEGSLERVRSVAMGMKKPEDMLDVCKTIARQLELLKVKEIRNVQTAIFDEHKRTYANYEFYVKHDKALVTEVDYDNHPVSKGFAEQMLKGPNQVWITAFKGREVTDWLNYHKSTNVFIDTYLETADTLNYYWYSLGPVAIGMSSYVPLRGDEIELFQRFRNVFELSYRRYLDIEMAEAQAKEAKIEAALEKVRSRSLAMHKSHELQDVVHAVFERLNELNFELDTAIIIIFTEGSKDTVWWLQNSVKQQYLRITVDYADIFYLRNLFEAKENKKDLLPSFYSLEQKNELLHYLFDHTDFRFTPPEQKESLLQKECATMSAAIAKNTAIHITRYFNKSFSEKEEEILKKFSNVFEQAYTRFLDLQRAEAQTRESQIQLGLERVRAKTMAMQKSEELAETVSVLFDQFISLGEEPERMAIEIVNEEEHVFEIWATQHGGSQLDRVLKVSLDEPHVMQKMYKAWKEQKKSITIDLQGNELEEYFQFLKAKGLPVKREIFGKRRIQNVATFSKGILTIITPEPRPQETIQLLERFAAVFNGTYTRFLDLQKAEAQARESQIQLALERVRARTMAMQKSDELAELMLTIFRSITSLGIPDQQVEVCYITTFESGEPIGELYLAKDNSFIPGSYKIRFDEDPFFTSIYEHWKNGESFFVGHLKGSPLHDHFRYMRGHTTLPAVQTPEEVASQLDETFTHALYFSQGYLAIVTRQPVDSFHPIFIRFGNVLQQTYTRFLDLQKAEAQARESQVQLALERVRARSLAMHNSTELHEVAEVLFQQLVSFGGNILNAGIALCKPDADEDEFWVSSESGIRPMISIPHTDDPIQKKLYEGWTNKLEFYSESKGGDELRAHYNYLISVPSLKPFFEEGVGSNRSFPTWQKWHAAYFSHGYVFLMTVDEYHEEKILVRFARIFEQAYTRFLDLQTAEAQARESQIQLALERVRARTMAMQKSEELREVVAVIYEQLQQLGFVQEGSCNINIMDVSTGSVDWWMTGFGNQKYPHRYHVEYIDHPMHITQLAVWKSGKKYTTIEVAGESKKEFDKLMLSQADFENMSEETKTMIASLDRVIFSMAFMKYGALSWAANPITDEQANILQRFARVFEQTYTRFLDLQRAEAQARESQIQLALERVRARTMAMQRSEELSEAVYVLFQQFHELGENPDQATIGIVNEEENVIEYWVTMYGNQMDRVFKFSIDEPHVTNRIYKAWKQGHKSLVIDLSGKELLEFTAYRESMGGAKRRPDEKRRVINVAFFSKGLLNVQSNETRSDESIHLLARFATVFDQTYTRFLDLQKAEGQAREAKIEAALERTRTQSMLMQHSQELDDTLRVFHEQVLSLGIKSAFSFLWLPDENKDRHIFWAAWAENSSKEFKSKAINYPLDRNEPATAQCLIDWKKNQPVISYHVPPGGVEGYFAAWQELIAGVEELKPGNFNDGLYYVEAFMKYGCFGVMVKSELSEDEKKILYRFAVEFERTYTRFLDLQKAEAQTRQAKIETAMEKVRSRAMAMQKPEELVGVAELLREEMGLLGVEELETSSIYIHNENNRTTECWYAIQDIREGKKKLIADYMSIQLNDTWVGKEMLKFYQSGKKQASILMKGEKRREWINYCSQHSKLLQGYYGDIIPERTYHLIKFSNGYMGAASPGDISAESWELLKRATTVFSLAYTRFSDLQKAEAHAKETVKQSALDRIRADIASMRTTADLDKITPLIWNELTILGIPFTRCGVFIMDDSQKLIHSFLSTPEGKAIAAFNIPYDSPGNIEQVLSHWQSKKDYIYHWDEKAYTEFANTLVKQGALDSSEKYLHSIPHDGSYLHFLPFLQGMLYVGNTDKLNDEQIELVQHVTDAFSTAYARYEDFNKLEAAKQQVEKTLTDLKQAQTQLVQSEKMASLGELTAGIAHEIQNPLNFVNNFSEVSRELIDELKSQKEKLKKEEQDGILNDIDANLEKILHHGKRADAIVKGMLQHSRTSSSQKELTDINALADEYLRLAYHGLRAKDKSFNAKFTTDFDNKVDKINIIPQEIGRVILNLINNAFYAVSQRQKSEGKQYEPTVSVSTKKIADKVEIIVKDNGTGIPQKVLDKIFQPFFTTKPTGQGTGLGLSLAYDIITKGHNGEIKIETKEGEGSKFIVIIPSTQ